ncbi:MAG: hypothetical protein ACXVFT_17805 [Solirubrobacteraceae bacterium]
MHHFSRAALGAASVAMFAVPAGASAATKTVLMGEPTAVQNTFERRYSSDVDAFFPSKITVHVGDSVRFDPVSFHTVDFPKKGGKSLGLVSPGAPVSGASDAAGAPFWFNGQPQLGFTAALQKSGFGKTFTYTGAKPVRSGLPFANKPKPMTVRFTKAGSFTFYCNVHEGMKGRVKVVPKSKHVPSAAADKARVAAQVARDLRVAKSLGSTKAPAKTVIMGPSGTGGVELYGFAPARLTVPVGTTVTFRMPNNSREDHTATFGPGNPDKEPGSYLGKLAASFNTPAFDPAATYSSDKPGTVATFTPALHGNGFWNTGVLDTTPATPLPALGTVTFGQPGTYDFYCLIHTFMHGQVVVQ